jgi:predicted MFS family arabinose efflux permease
MTMQKPLPPQANVRPLWLVILAAATAVGIAMGLRQVMGLYMKPISLELGLGRQSFSLAIAIANIVWGIAAPFTGAFTDTYGTGKVLALGALATAAGLLVMTNATTEAGLIGSGVLLGLGVAAAGVNALVGTVARRATPETRAAAVAALGMGSGVGILLALPYTHVLISELGWKPSLMVLAATSLVILPIAWFLSGKPEQHAAGAKRQGLGEALAEAFRLPDFWLLNAGFFVCGFHVVFYGTHLPAYVADQGLPEWVSTAALTLVGLGNLAGTWLAGQWARAWPKRIGLSLIYLGRAVVFLGFLFLPINAWTVIGLSAALGLLWLSTIPLTSTLVSTFFGPAWMTMLYGIVFFSHQIGSFLGVWLGGVVFDKLKSYDDMWWISVGLGVFAALVHWPIRERPVRRLAAGTA